MVFRYIAAAFIVIAAGVYAGELRTGRPFTGALPPLERLPAELSGWQAQDTPASAGVAQALAADVTLHRCFLRPDGSEVCLLVAYFAQQQVNSQIHSPRHCLPGGGWDVSSMQAATLVAAGAEQPATRMRIVRSGTAQDVYYWFSTQSGTVTDEYALKWNLVKNSLLGRPTNAAFVRYNAATADSTALREIFAHLQPALQAMLANVGLK